MGDEEVIMCPKEHGTSHVPPQPHLRWGCNRELADRLCNFDRAAAENPHHFDDRTTFLQDVVRVRRQERLQQQQRYGQQQQHEASTITFYDSNMGKPVFEAPRGRTWDEFLVQAQETGWLTFHDNEVVWENVRCLRGGETVTVDGTHLGHNFPMPFNRYLINIVCVAGFNHEEQTELEQEVSKQQESQKQEEPQQQQESQQQEEPKRETQHQQGVQDPSLTP